MPDTWIVFQDPLIWILVILVAIQAAVIALLLTERRRRRQVDASTRAALHDLAHLNGRAAMGEVVSSVAHELAQSLTVSIGNAQALQRMIQTGRRDDPDFAVIVEDIQDANRQASQIIRRIRTMMRKEPFEVRPCDLNSIVLDVVHVLHSSAAGEGVLLVADVDRDLPAVPGDRIQLRQVAMNLVLNAIQASRGRTAGPKLVRLKTRPDGDRVLLIVEDNGPGFPDTAIHRLFEPYFTTKSDGLGLGLSITRSIVDSHGGAIHAANRPTGGARFSVVLPCERTELPTPSRPGMSSSPMLADRLDRASG